MNCDPLKFWLLLNFEKMSKSIDARRVWMIVLASELSNK